MSVQVQTKAVVSVAEMARMVGMSRARFYQLLNEGVFPPPLYRIETRRPFFNQQMQETDLLSNVVLQDCVRRRPA
jgi:hypothetical protein